METTASEDTLMINRRRAAVEIQRIIHLLQGIPACRQQRRWAKFKRCNRRGILNQ